MIKPGSVLARELHRFHSGPNLVQNIAWGPCHAQIQIVTLGGRAYAWLRLSPASGSARADEIYIGTLTPRSGFSPPTSGGCTLGSMDEGYVCSGQQTFTAEGATLTATGYDGVFATQENLTLKTVGTNGMARHGWFIRRERPWRKHQRCK